MMRMKRCGILSVAATALVLAVCPGGARASQPAEATPQQIVNRLVQEPWTFEGRSDQRITLGQPSLYNGRKPARLLVGLRPQGQDLSGELVSLDAENRPLAAVPIRGAYTSSPTPDARAVPCRLIVDFPKPLTLDGTCGPGGLAGRFHNAEKALPLMFVAPDLYGRHTTEGTYWLRPRRS